MYALIASAALLATSAVAQSVGSAIVVNACEYEVYVCDVPAADGGFSEIDKTLQPNDTFTQSWTELTNGDGWSIKLSKDTTLSNIMQYEYTFLNDGIIWYDLSDVNGNPWDGNWEITASSASGTCSPKQQAYRYATDDAYGMQACPQDSVITVTLCSGESQDNGGAASASSSVAAVTSSIATATSVSTFTTPTTSVPATSAFPTWHTWIATGGSSATANATEEASATATSTSVDSTTSSSTVAATTFATSTTSTTSVITTAPDGVTVTDVATAVVTDIVTATQWWHPHAKRNEAANRHAHHARHGHA